MSIGERITELRKSRNISQIQIAKALDVSRQAVSKWENDLSSPDTVKLIQLADLLDTDLEYLACGRKRVPPSPPESLPPSKSPDVIEKIIEVEKIVEVEKIIEVERFIEVEKPVIRRRLRVKYIRNPLEYAAVFILGFLIGAVFSILI